MADRWRMGDVQVGALVAAWAVSVLVVSALTSLGSVQVVDLSWCCVFGRLDRVLELALVSPVTGVSQERSARSVLGLIFQFLCCRLAAVLPAAVLSSAAASGEVLVVPTGAVVRSREVARSVLVLAWCLVVVRGLIVLISWVHRVCDCLEVLSKQIHVRVAQGIPQVVLVLSFLEALIFFVDLLAAAVQNCSDPLLVTVYYVS